jgi:ATP-binding cassette subfamily B multidrug efflux pump
MVLIVGHRLVGEGVLTIGDMFAFWILLQRFFEPLRQLSEKYNVLQSAMASGERLALLLDTDDEIKSPAEAKKIAELGEIGDIEFKDVHFSYDGETEVLHGISFSAKRGEKIAIVGATGAGKSSLINVLSRFYEISSGSVTLSGVDIRELDKHDLRRSVGVVLQEVFLFADTIRENLRLGDESYSDAVLHDAINRVYATEFLSKLNGGLDFEVEERGATFSLGQKQLLAFARTLVHNPPILVLDEATANIDTETEHLIQLALERLMEKRTVIVIAHRLSTIKKADRIIVMHHGEIHEQGTHEELLSQGGLYRRLYELQYRSQDEIETTTRANDE